MRCPICCAPVEWTEPFAGLSICCVGCGATLTLHQEPEGLIPEAEPREHVETTSSVVEYGECGGATNREMCDLLHRGAR